MKSVAKSVRTSVIVVCAILFVSLVAFAALYFFSSNTLDNMNSVKQEEMLGIVLEWGRLAPFPVSATNISIETEGSSFTRSFRASFIAPKEDIQDWLSSSPGLQETTAEEVSDSIVWYSIKPGGGANRAEVTIDYGLNKVEIYVSWS
jgi:hypothetical protein